MGPDGLKRLPRCVSRGRGLGVWVKGVGGNREGSVGKEWRRGGAEPDGLKRLPRCVPVVGGSWWDRGVMDVHAWLRGIGG